MFIYLLLPFIAIGIKPCLSKYVQWFNRMKRSESFGAAGGVAFERAAYCLIMFLITVFLASMRSVRVGIDTQQFCDAYQTIGELGWFDYSQLRYEPGFFLLCKALNLLSENPQTLIVCSSFLIMSAVFLTIFRYADDVALSSALFFTTYLFIPYLNLMRQMMAVSILLIALPWLLNKKYVLYSLAGIIATGFHFSAFVGLLLIPLISLKLTVKTSLIMYILVGCFGFICMPIITGLLGDMFYGQYVSNYFGQLYIFSFQLIVVLIPIYFISKKAVSGSVRWISAPLGSTSFERTVMHGALLAVLFSALHMRAQIMGRFEWLFSFYIILLIPQAISKISAESLRLQLRYITFAVTYIFYLVIVVVRPEWHGAIPYLFFWQ